MSKSILTWLLAVMMLASLTACGQQTAPQEPNSAASGQEEPPSAPPEEAETPPAGPDGSSSGGKVLAAYYSATGSTKAVAGYIADALNADTFEIIPVEPYTSGDLDWTDSDSRVSREHDNPALRTMELAETSVEGWEDYETVFIGYPIWWGIAAWPVDNFVSANDFTGKTVIPFCTSSSSGMGDSGTLLRELAGTGDWLDGQRFRSSVAEADVAEWVDSLEITG